MSGYGIRGWETESLPLRSSLNRPDGKTALVAAAASAGLIVFAFPLYVDSLPYLVTRAMTLLAAGGRRGQRVAAVVNSGFPEQHQNAVALAICAEFARQSGRTWAGGLAFGGGGMIGTNSLAQPKRNGPALAHIVPALELAADALAEGLPVPAEALKMSAKTVLPPMIFNRLYMWIGGRGFKRSAAQNGVSPAALLAQPYTCDGEQIPGC